MTTPFTSEMFEAVLPGGSVILQVTFETSLGSGTLQTVSDPLLVISSVGTGTVIVSTTDLTTEDDATW
jgi:hypothetical protein